MLTLIIVLGALIGGISIVLVSRSPYFGIFGVLLQAVSFSILLCVKGLPFFGLLTVLVYIGGMLIIFLFSTVLRAERYPDSAWGESFVFWILAWVLSVPIINDWGFSGVKGSSLFLRKERGLGEIFSGFGILVCLVVVVLLVALIVVLAFGYEHSEGNLRKL